jgi:hypothetical protein
LTRELTPFCGGQERAVREKSLMQQTAERHNAEQQTSGSSDHWRDR